MLLVCICANCCFCIDFSGIFIDTRRKIASTIGQRSIDTGFLIQCIDLPALFVCILIEIFQRTTDGIIVLNNISVRLIISFLIQLTENSSDIVLIGCNLLHLFRIESLSRENDLVLEISDISFVCCNLILQCSIRII